MSEKCYLCPHCCGALRPDKKGVCGASSLKLAHADLHFYEEPVISGTRGSGAVFFSGCPLSCVFCQNHTVSQGLYGKEITPLRLSEIFLSLQDRGCHNINLVSPTPYIRDILDAVELCKGRLNIPLVYNSSGYEKKESLRMLDGCISVYLPDLKYVSMELSERLSHCPDYPTHATEAIGEMLRQRPRVVIEDGIMQSGIIVRHLVLPSLRRESIRVLDTLSSLFSSEGYLLSLMAQYRPMYKASEIPEIDRFLTSFEYKSVADHALKLGFKGFFQGSESHNDGYTPNFDCSNI